MNPKRYSKKARKEAKRFHILKKIIEKMDAERNLFLNQVYT